MRESIVRYIGDQLLSGRVAGVVAADDDLLAGGLVDSLGIIQLVTFLEEEFALEIPPEDVTIEHFQTVAKIDAYLRGRLTPRMSGEA
jgi:acyl carrier protein